MPITISITRAPKRISRRRMREIQLLLDNEIRRARRMEVSA